MTLVQSAHPRVFISYALESEISGHRQRALDLAQSLRLRGIEAVIDQFVEHDPPFWPRWMADEVKTSDFVLCLASPLYKTRVEMAGDPSIGRGSRWEGAIITNEMYSGFPSAQSRFIAIVLDGCSIAHIPDVLLPVGRSFYEWPRDDEDLYRRLTNQPKVIPAPLGEIVKFETEIFKRRRAHHGDRTKTAFFVFHMERDIWRAQQIISMGVVDGQEVLDHPNELNSLTHVDAIKKWIDHGMQGSNIVVVLVGAETANRHWVQFEVAHAWERGMPIMGIRIHGLVNASGLADGYGPNPFEHLTFSDGRPAANEVPLYEPTGSTSQAIYANIMANMASWVGNAVRRSD
jgi:hypothetical protein